MEGKVYRVKYQILTPVHIGMGEDLSPFDYVITGNVFHRIITDEIISSLDQKKIAEFYSFIEQGDITKLRSLIVENFDEERFSKYKVKVTENVAEKYRKNLDNINNQLLISPFIRTSDDFKPYIPGSSIKGAIRTAIIDAVVQEKRKKEKYKPPDKPKDNRWEFEVLKADISRDPFRILKVSDVFVSNEAMMIGEVLNARVNEAKGKLKTIGIQMIKEVLLGQINDGKVVEFEGVIKFDEFLSDIKNRKGEKAVSMPLTKDFVIESCNNFYGEEFKREQKFYQLAMDMHDILDRMRALLSPGKDECIIRVGRFSGISAVTINNFRIKEAKTRNLFEGKYPMGWVKIKFIGEEKQ